MIMRQGGRKPSCVLLLRWLVASALVALGAAAPHAAATNTIIDHEWARCRCLPHDSCWQRIDWAALNSSVHGRLEVSVDEMAPCTKDINSVECSHALEGSDDEFWLSSKPNGYQHTGLFGVWNLADRLSSYAVRARTESDFVAAVQFAAKNDLRLVVKATGHDWYGRSTAAGSLLLWTHLRKNITWHSAFVSAGSTGSKGVPAVTVQSDVQFSDLYPAAQATPFPGDPQGRRTIVMGGGCDSVGVGGCWLGGCCILTPPPCRIHTVYIM
jgi:hypothetical protein